MQNRPPPIRRMATTFADWINSLNGRPLLKGKEAKILGSPFGHSLFVGATHVDNAVTSEDLRVSSKWDNHVTGVFGSSSANLRGVLNIQGLGIYVHSGAFAAETATLKQALDNQLYIQIACSGQTINLPMRSHIYEAFEQQQFVGALASGATSAEARVRLAGRPLILARPLQIDLESDTFTLKDDTGVNWSSGNIPMYVEILGTISPKGVWGADGVNHTNVIEADYAQDANGAKTSVPFAEYAQYNAAFMNRIAGFLKR